MEYALDEAAIASVIKRERWYRDTAQFDKMRSQFHSDGKKTWVNVTWMEGDIDEFTRRWSARPATKQHLDILHRVEPILIQVREDRAISDSLCDMSRQIEYEGHQFVFQSLVRLLSRFAKEDGNWRMLSLEAIYIRDSITNALPTPPSYPPNVDDVASSFPKSYRNLAWSLLRQGITPSPNLPHNDDPESIDRVLKRQNRYLEGLESESSN